MEINKNDEIVIIRYNDGQITIYNEDRTISGYMEISSSELRKM